MDNIIDFVHKNIGFSWRGFIIVMLAMLPNILFAIVPPSNMPSDLKSGGILMNILEHGTQIVFLVLFIFMTKNGKGNSAWLIVSASSIVIYYGLWIHYFMNGRDYVRLFTNQFFGISLPMVILPILYFISASLWLNSIPILVLVMMFAVGHIGNSYVTLLSLKR